MTDDNRISIWFFIGSLLAVYGVIIVAVSIPALLNPADQPDVVLPGLHAGIWWGALLVVLGVMYVIVFWPWKKKADEQS
ncbi:MAG: hypothetical protein LJF06_16750 [Gemmatimonadetes bacterium]|jgi:hypothetical protein|nr:hypothetical protein [Gemmatimonadota bacterium]